MNLSPTDSDSLCSPSRARMCCCMVEELGQWPFTSSSSIQSNRTSSRISGKGNLFFPLVERITHPPASLSESLYVFTRYPPTQHFFPSLPSGFPPNRRGYRYSSPLLPSPLCALALKQPRDQISRYEQEQPSHSVSS